MTHLSFNWPPDRPEFKLATESDPSLAEAVGLSIALKYFGSQAQGFDAASPWRTAADRAISVANRLDPESSST